MKQQQPVSILLVEDENDACEVISSMLEMKFPATQIYCAANGKIGLDMFGMNLPDIVITDINMPEMDGLKMLDIIHTVKPDACVIVITAHSSTHHLKQIVASSTVVELVPKPIDFEILFAAVQRCIESLPGVD
ncbi:MAG: response regulator [Desulfuromonadaceae bacterium]|nr:response regulator [Desulfuromonadaceae bacterium]